MTAMLTFPLPQLTKTDFLADLHAHREADRLVKGSYWRGGRGCAIGCSLESARVRLGKSIINFDHGNHAAYEEYLGIPEVLAQLEDRLFEGLPVEEAKGWPVRFVEAAPVGVDLCMVWPWFALWLLTEEVPQHARTEQEWTAIVGVADLYREWVAGEKPAIERWAAARDIAASYVAHATHAAAHATHAAAHAAHAHAAAYAAANAAAHANAATHAATHACHIRMADKLIEIIADTGCQQVPA